MELDALLRSLEATSVATAIRENESLFPWVESVHVFAIALSSDPLRSSTFG